MDLGDVTLFRAFGEKMDYLGQRQRVLAQNIANANTPRYVPRDLKPFDFQQAVGRFQHVAQQTDGRHLAGTLGNPRPFADPEDRRVYESSPDGNQVVMEEQVLKASQTRMDYQLMTRLYEKNMGMIRMALRPPGGS